MTTEPGAPPLDPLLAALAHPNPHVRAGAAIALGKAGESRAVEPLAETLEDPVYLVYTCAARALGRLGSLAAGTLIAVIQDPPTLDSTSRAYDALRAIRDPQAIGLLTAATGYDEPHIRWGAIEALGNMHAQQAVPALIDAVRHPDENTRQHAAIALGRIGAADGIQPVASLLNESNWQIRLAAVQALGRMGTEAVILPLLTMMRDTTIQVREAAAQALQNLREPETVGILTAALNGADAWTRCSLARATGEIGDRSTIPLLERLALEDDDVKVRLSAAQGLAKMNHPRGEMVILRTLNAPSAQTRTHAAIALGNTGNPRAVDALLQSEALIGHQPKLGDSRQLRLEIVNALVSVGAEAVPALVEALESPYSGVREAAFNALRQMGPEAVPGLVKTFEDTTRPPLRQSLIKLLGAIADQRAAAPLTEVLRRGVSSAFSPRWLVMALVDPNMEERKLAADALGAMSSEGVSVLLETARYDLDQEVREHASRALAELGDAESILRLAQPQVFGEVGRSFLSVSVLILIGFVMGAFAQLTGEGRLGLLAGWGAGAFVGGMDGLAARKRVVRGVMIGLGLVALWGVFDQIFGDSPSLPELVRFPPVQMGAWFMGGGGVLTGVWVVNPLFRDNQVRYLPRGCVLLLMPGMLGLVGLIAGGVTGAVLVLEAGNPGFFRWLGGGALGVLFVISWLQRGKRVELQKGLLASLALLGMMLVGAALALSMPDAVTAWLAPVFPIIGALFGWQSMPLPRRLAGLFGGMIAGFVGAGVGMWVTGMVK